jgi:Domain of unknown function (DUF4382)
MYSKKSLLVSALVPILAVSSCSGLKNNCANCGFREGGNVALSMTISDTPSPNTSVVSFALPIIGITLTPSTGSPVLVFSSGNYELTRLQSDTSLIVANKSIAAGTYNAVNVTVSAPSAVYSNASSGSFGTCLPGEFCSITGNAATITYTFTTPLTLAANANQWLNLDFNYKNAIVTNGSAVAIDVTQRGVMTASSVVPAGVASGAFANLDDFTGAVTAISSSSITVESSVRGTLTETITSSTQVFDPQSQCTNATTGLDCIQKGSIVSMHGVLTTSGVPTATSLDIIDISTTPADEVEGIIYPKGCNGGSNYGMVLSDSAIFATGSPLASTTFGTEVCLALSPNVAFAVDSGMLTGQPSVPNGTNVVGFRSASDLLEGQMIRARITGATTGTNGVNATATVLLLRLPRVTGSISTSLPPPIK